MSRLVASFWVALLSMGGILVFIAPLVEQPSNTPYLVIVIGCVVLLAMSLFSIFRK